MATLLGEDEGGRRLIEPYIADLRAQLRFHGVSRRRAERVVAEARDHLVELAAEHGEEEAVERFGSANVLAVAAASVLRPPLLLGSALVFLAAAALFVLPLYAIPENTLPAAPWDERPAHLTWAVYAAQSTFAVSLAAALVAAAAAFARSVRVARWSLRVAAAALATSATAGVVGAALWTQEVPGSGVTLVLSLLATALAGCVAAAALASAERVSRFARDLSR